MDWTQLSGRIFPRSDQTPAEEKANARLLEAAKAGWIEETMQALTDGADVNSQDGQHTTALHWAVIGTHPEVARLLVAKGADINLQDNLKQTPLDIAEKELKATNPHYSRLIADRSTLIAILNAAAAAKQQRHTVDQTVGEFLLGTDAVKEDEQDHAARVTGERKDKGPPQVGG
jgi:Ankyrin repeats (many copies)